MDIYSLLDTVPTTLSNTAIHYLMDFGRKMEFEVGQMVFREDDPSDRVYIILDGEAHVIKGDEFGNSHIIATAEKGSLFGEMGVFLDLHRSGSIAAKTTLSVLSLKNEDFLSSIQHFPDLTLRLFKSLSMKLDSVNEKLSSLINATSMVQLGTYILEQLNNNKHDNIYNFNLIINDTALDRRDIVNTLINFNRLGILDQLQFKEDDKANFDTNIEQLQSYLKRISLNPARG